MTQELANWDYETKRVDVLTQVSQAFIEVLTAQQRLVLTQQTQELADQVITAASARVQAGKVSPVEETKASVVRASVGIELMRSQRELEAARKRLAASWGSTAPQFEAVAGDLDTIRPPRSLESLLQRLISPAELLFTPTNIAVLQLFPKSSAATGELNKIRKNNTPKKRTSFMLNTLTNSFPKNSNICRIAFVETERDRSPLGTMFLGFPPRFLKILSNK